MISKNYSNALMEQISKNYSKALMEQLFSYFFTELFVLLTVSAVFLMRAALYLND